jgi:hypothetical protein
LISVSPRQFLEKRETNVYRESITSRVLWLFLVSIILLLFE